MGMIALDDRKLSTANVHPVLHKRFKQPTNHILLIIIHILMHLNPSLVRPLWHQTPKLLIGIIGVLIDTDPINLVLNGRFNVLEHVAETWWHSAVLVPVFCIEIVFIEGKPIRKYVKA